MCLRDFRGLHSHSDHGGYRHVLTWISTALGSRSKSEGLLVLRLEDSGFFHPPPLLLLDFGRLLGCCLDPRAFIFQPHPAAGARTWELNALCLTD